MVTQAEAAVSCFRALHPRAATTILHHRAADAQTQLLPGLPGTKAGVPSGRSRGCAPARAAGGASSINVSLVHFYQKWSGKLQSASPEPLCVGTLSAASPQPPRPHRHPKVPKDVGGRVTAAVTSRLPRCSQCCEVALRYLWGWGKLWGQHSAFGDRLESAWMDPCRTAGHGSQKAQSTQKDTRPSCSPCPGRKDSFPVRQIACNAKPGSCTQCFCTAAQRDFISMARWLHRAGLCPDMELHGGCRTGQRNPTS